MSTAEGITEDIIIDHLIAGVFSICGDNIEGFH